LTLRVRVSGPRKRLVREPLVAGGDCEEADAQAVVPVRGPAPDAARRPAGGAAAEPAAAPEHPGRAPRLEVILAPLPDVAVHVVDAEPVRFIRAHFGGPLEVPGLGRVARGVAAVEVGLFGGEVVGGLRDIAGGIAEVEVE